MPRHLTCGWLGDVSAFSLRIRSGETSAQVVDTPPEEPARAVSPSSPFRGDRVAARLAPFALGALLAQFSLLLPPGVRSAPAAYVSGALLVAASAGILLVPWDRLQRRAAVVVPLLYCGSALALTLASERDSGLGVVVLIPLLWTALFHTKWESAAVVVSVVVVEFVVSAALHEIDATIIRRVVLWGLLGAVISVSVHGLRDRVLAAHRRSEQLRDQLRRVELNEDRLRIALRLQDDVVKRIFAATLTLRAIPAGRADTPIRSQVDKAVGELDEAVLLLRHAVFGIEAADSEAPVPSADD